MRKHGSVVSVRSLAPILFIVSLVVLAVLAPFSHLDLLLLEVEIALYVLGALVFGVLAIRAKRERLRLLPRVLAAFVTFHVAYGLGMAAGWFRKGGSVSPIGRVSVVAPMYNEADHIEDVVADVAAQDFEGELEFIVADGESTDGSVELLRAAAERHGLGVRLIDNPERWVSHGLNAAVRAATGDLVDPDRLPQPLPERLRAAVRRGGGRDRRRQRRRHPGRAGTHADAARRGLRDEQPLRRDRLVAA